MFRCLTFGGMDRHVIKTHRQNLHLHLHLYLKKKEDKWSSSWGLVLLLLILVSVLLASTLIHIGRRHRHSGQRLSRSAAYFPFRGRARWVGRRRWRLSRRRESSRGVSFYFPFYFFLVKKNLLFF